MCCTLIFCLIGIGHRLCRESFAARQTSAIAEKLLSSAEGGGSPAAVGSAYPSPPPLARAQALSQAEPRPALPPLLPLALSTARHTQWPQRDALLLRDGRPRGCASGGHALDARQLRTQHAACTRAPRLLSLHV
eukprot:6196608-Pleurochrysis_carterae.AAC.3